MKTIEELALKKYPKHIFQPNEIGVDLSSISRNAFIEVYLKASETLYSKEEVIQIVEKTVNYYKSSCINIKGTANIEFLADIEIGLKSLKINENS